MYYPLITFRDASPRRGSLKPDSAGGSVIVSGMVQTESMGIPASSTGGRKEVKAARFDLVPWKAMWQVAEVYAAGAAKYDDHNWRKGYPWSSSFASLMRHATQFWEGESHDEELGFHHLGAVVFHALCLLTFEDDHPNFDDRPSTQLRLFDPTLTEVGDPQPAQIITGPPHSGDGTVRRMDSTVEL